MFHDITALVSLLVSRLVWRRAVVGDVAGLAATGTVQTQAASLTDARRATGAGPVEVASWDTMDGSDWGHLG